jgi:hypothetical protein
LAGLGEGGGAEGLDADAEGSDGAGDEGAFLGGLAGEAHGGAIDVAELLGDAEGGEARAAGAEGVGLENLGAGFDVLLMDLPHHVGGGEVELVEAAVDEDAAGVQHGAHGAVGDPDASRQLFSKLLGPAAGCGHVGEIAAAPRYSLILASRECRARLCRYGLSAIGFGASVIARASF